MWTLKNGWQYLSLGEFFLNCGNEHLCLENGNTVPYNGVGSFERTLCDDDLQGLEY